MHFKINPHPNLVHDKRVVQMGKIEFGQRKRWTFQYAPKRYLGEIIIRCLVGESPCFCDQTGKSSFYIEDL